MDHGVHVMANNLLVEMFHLQLLPLVNIQLLVTNFFNGVKNRASLFLDKLYSTPNFDRQSWEQNIDTNTRKAWPQPSTPFNTEYALTTSFNPDIFYAPQKHAVQWLAILKMASDVEMNFEYAMASSAVGLTK
jgi:hypothetical protein